MELEEAGFALDGDVAWDQNAQDITFAAIGNLNSTFTRGKDYGGQADTTTTGALTSGLDDLVSGYGLFENTEKVEVDFILMGSAGYAKGTSKHLLISVLPLLKQEKMQWHSSHHIEVQQLLMQLLKLLFKSDLMMTLQTMY